jgi:hypothetical protein
MMAIPIAACANAERKRRSDSGSAMVLVVGSTLLLIGSQF